MSMKFDVYSEILADLIQSNIDSPHDGSISMIRSLWDNESWESIISKFRTGGSVWCVWWSDGVSAYMQLDDTQ